MPTSDVSQLQGFYNSAKALGLKSVSSDGTMVIEGHEDTMVLIKQFPWPMFGPAGEIEISTPMGGGMWQAQTARTHQQGPITFSETLGGRIMSLQESLLNNAGAQFDATMYEGSPQKFVRGYRVRGCIYVPDQIDRDAENKAQVTLMNGTLFFHFFGEKIPGNATSL